MNKNRIYLAGPIKGITYTEATDWRKYVANNVKENIQCLSPLRGLNYLSDTKALITRDRFDVQRCDILFVNLLSAKEISIETIMEIAWADSKRIPIILIIEESGNVHDNFMITKCAGFRTDNLDDAIFIANNIL